MAKQSCTFGTIRCCLKVRPTTGAKCRSQMSFSGTPSWRMTGNLAHFFFELLWFLHPRSSLPWPGPPQLAKRLDRSLTKAWLKHCAEAKRLPASARWLSCPDMPD